MDFTSAAAEQPTTARKPEGGFRFISVFQIVMAWWAYVEGRIRYRDVRAYFACHELVSRRCIMEAGTRPEYGLDELHRLVGGVGGEHLRASLRRLEGVGLIACSSTSISFAESPDELRVGDLSGFWAILERGGFRNRKIPVPRRTVRFIASGARKLIVATMLGHLIRCVFYRQGACHTEGCCKASLVAEVFGVSTRQVKAARKHLGEIGWLCVTESEQWHKNRFGGRAVINLWWSRPVDDRLTEPSPPTAVLTTESSPPESDIEPSSRSKNQKPTERGPTGACSKGEEPEEPTMKHVVPQDLSDTARLLKLFEDAQRLGLVGSSEADRLRFVAAADRARTVGTINPCGFFVRMVRAKLWHHITQDDEDAANIRLKRHLHGHEQPKRRTSGIPAMPQRQPAFQLSEDARLVAAVARVAQQHRLTCDPFYVLRRERPEWTRERWDAATDELANARLHRLQASRDVVLC